MMFVFFFLKEVIKSFRDRLPKRNCCPWNEDKKKEMVVVAHIGGIGWNGCSLPDHGHMSHRGHVGMVNHGIQLFEWGFDTQYRYCQWILSEHVPTRD